MMTAEHISFDQLSSECKCILNIIAMGANLRTVKRHRLSGEVLASVVRSFWNSSHFGPADLRNLNNMTERLCLYHNTTRTLQN